MSEKQHKVYAAGNMSSAQLFDAMLAEASLIPHPNAKEAPPPRALTRAEEISARAKAMVESEADARAKKTARLRAARLGL